MDKLKDVDIESVAAMLGVTDKSIRTWVKDFGCPSSKDGRARTFYWPDVLAWYVDYASAKKGGVAGDFAPDNESDEQENLQAAMLRKTKAEADLKQLALAKLRGQVIGIDDARLVLDRMFANLKAQLLSAAPLLNTRLEGEPDSVSREGAIREFMENLCRELATGKIVREADGEDDETADSIDVEATAEDITDEDVNEIVVEFIAAHADLEPKRHA